MSPPPALPSSIPVAIVGAGQAGLSLSWFLRARDIAHVVLERDVPVQSWRHERWDSFRLVTPNWQCALPGHPYRGPDPDGFLARDEVVAYLESFVASFDPPVIPHVEVRALTQAAGGGFRLDTDTGCLHAGQVVVATGGYHTPAIPEAASALPAAIRQFTAADYRGPAQLPPGAVLVVGSGLSGAQIAEELLAAGREVHLAVGAAPRISRRYRGRDCHDWLARMGAHDIAVEDHPLGEAVRDVASHVVSGLEGGRDIDLRRAARAGMRLHGRLLDVRGGTARFGDDLAPSLDAADAADAAIRASIDDWIAAHGIEAPAEAPSPSRPWVPPDDLPLTLDLVRAGIVAIVWCTGFRPAFGWIAAPVLDARGRPVHRRGVTDTPGLYFLGLPWLHSWGSGRMSGVARDAEYLAARIADLAPGIELFKQRTS